VWQEGFAVLKMGFMREKAVVVAREDRRVASPHSDAGSSQEAGGGTGLRSLFGKISSWGRWKGCERWWVLKAWLEQITG
jgi:hypothetical protein